RTRAIGVFTFTPSVPSATSSSRTTPSSTDSTSMVALSVSISAKTSPDFTVSPTLTSHFASLPSSIVGDRAGMRIWGISALQNGIAGHGGHAANFELFSQAGRQHAPVIDRCGGGIDRRRGSALVDYPTAQDQPEDHEN